MGFDPEWLSEHNPDVIQAHVTAFGWEGPYSHRPGVDPLAQAWMGLQRAQGGPENPPVFLAQLAPTDFTAGAMGALGAVMALYVRERTGKARNLYTNLLNAGALLTCEGFMRYEGKPPRRLADKGQYGLSALHRLYQTSDGWLYVSAEAKGEWPRLCAAIGGGDLLKDAWFVSTESRAANDQALAAELEAVFSQLTNAEWDGRLKKAGVSFAPVTNWMESSFFDDAHVWAEGLEVKCHHPNFGEMRYVRQATSFGNTAPINSRCVPLLGEHTREILQEVGYAQDEIDELYEKGIALTEKPG
jgi:crotonobetainyl-CoA:carnitine CoA-transferase CaiB-like acyl-CoA transferase